MASKPSATVILAGDIVPTRPMGQVSASAQPVFDLIRQADVAIGNLEIALTDKGTPIDKMIVRRAAPNCAHGNPFHILSVANNHTMDFGWIGLQDTIECLSRSGATVIGGGPDLTSAIRPDIRKVGDIRIGTLALSCLAPGNISASENQPGIAALRVDTSYVIDPRRMDEEPGDPSAICINTSVRSADLLRVQEATKTLKSECDFAIVSIHWGYGSTEAVAGYQWPLGCALIDSGADVVHGHHPHAVQAIAAHKGKPILFSQGTFMAQQFFLPADEITRKIRAGMSSDGYLASITVPRGSLAPRIVIRPTILNSERQPVFADESNFARIAGTLVRLSKQYGVEFQKEHDGLLMQINAATN